MNSKDLNNTFLEIATSLVGGSLSLFIGTGFSMHLTNRSAPSWLDLIKECAKRLNNSKVYGQLFDSDGKCNFDLTVCAQILEDEYRKSDKDIRETVCEIVKEKINEESIDSDKTKKIADFFFEYNSINIITTNYDNILCDYILPSKSRVYVEGLNLPKVNQIQNIYHIHGSITIPQSLVLTQDDYFKFQHRESYISRKFYTLLQETTTVILGYSLNDFNLNRILNESKYSKNNTSRRNDIYYISREKVNDVYKTYYYSTFGIQVIDEMEIDEFFEHLSTYIDDAKLIVRGATRIPILLSGAKQYKDEFLKLGKSFSVVISRISAAGYNFNNQDIHMFLMDIINRKYTFTTENNAWDQYAHLASWLVELGELIDISESKIKEDYLEMVNYSFRFMSKELYLGYAWKAFEIWFSQWKRILPKNREIIIKMVKDSHFYKINGVKYLLEIE